MPRLSAVSLLLALAPVGAAAQDARCDLRLTGHVSEPYARGPLPEVHVTVEAIDGAEPPRTAHTTANGDFVVEGLCPGPHRVVAELHGYLPSLLPVELPSPHVDLVLEEDFEEVVVATERLGREDTRASTTVSGEALERTRGEDLAHALADVAGVSVLGGTSGTSQPMIRGLWGRRLLVLVDGVRHESQKWGADHGTEIDPFTAESLTVVRGAAGVRYGPDALGGVVLVTPRPLRTQPGIDGEAHLLGASNGLRGTAAFRLDGAHARAPGFAWRVEGNVARGRSLEAPDYTLGNTASLLWNAGATLGYHGPRVDLKLSYRHHDLEAGVFYGLASGSPAELEAAIARERPLQADLWEPSYTIDRPKQAVRHDTASVLATFDVGVGGRLEASYSYQHDRRQEFDQVRGSITGPQFDFTLRTHQADLHLDHPPIPVGGEVKMEGTYGASGAVQENVYVGLPLLPNYAAWSGGVYGIERFWHRVFEVELGARYDHQSQRTWLTDDALRRHLARDTLDADACVAEGEVASCPQAWDAGSVSVGVLVRPWPDRFHLKLDLSSASRFPDADELFLNGTAPTSPVYGVGDPSLAPETTWSASLTAEVDTRWVRAQASAWFQHVERYVSFAPELDDTGQPAVEVLIRGAFPRYTTRAVDARLYGFDGQITIGPEWPVQLTALTSVVRGEQVGGGYLPFVPPDRVRGALTGRLPDGWRLSGSFVAVTGTYVAEQTRWDAGTDLAPPPPGYGLLGLAAGTRLTVGDEEIGIGLEADNLLDTAYREATSLLRYYADEPGRDIRLRLSARWSL